MTQIESQKPHLGTWPLVRRIFRSYLRPRLGKQALAFLFMALDAGMTAGLALLLEPIFNLVFAGKNEEWVLPLALTVVGAFILRAAAAYAHGFLMNRVGQQVVSQVQTELFSHLIRSDLSFFHGTTTGRLVSRVTNDVAVMRQAAAESLTNIGKNTLSLIFLIAVMFSRDWRLAAAIFLLFPAASWGIAKLGRRSRKNGMRTQAELGVFAGLLSQVFQGMRQVKAYGMESYEEERARGVIHRLYKLSIRTWVAGSLSGPMMEFLNGVAIATTIAYGGYRIIGGHLTIGELMAFIAALSLAFEPMKRLAKLNAQLQVGLAAAERVFDALDMPAKIADAPNAQALELDDASIQLKSVGFRYADGTLALDGVDLFVPAGRTVALVGASGAGKSTILNLIPRFFDVDAGAVLVGGRDVRDVTMASLRANMALVTQEVAVFDDTVRANIGYGRMGASEAEIVEAAKAAAAHDFIMALPDGYDTPIGEQGVKLSGGQRQRLAIARAMLRNAPILLLDEATSALDTESERAVQAALKTLRQGRTTLIVAHRLSTIVDADLICVLDRGRIVEQGTHGELLRRAGAYARLYGQQEGAEPRVEAVQADVQTRA